MPASTPAAPVGLTLSQLTRPSELPPRGAPCSPSDLGGGTLQRQGHTQENDVLIDFLRNELAKWQSMEAVRAARLPPLSRSTSSPRPLRMDLPHACRVYLAPLVSPATASAGVHLSPLTYGHTVRVDPKHPYIACRTARLVPSPTRDVVD